MGDSYSASQSNISKVEDSFFLTFLGSGEISILMQLRKAWFGSFPICSSENAFLVYVIITDKCLVQPMLLAEVAVAPMQFIHSLIQ